MNTTRGRLCATRVVGLAVVIGLLLGAAFATGARASHQNHSSGASPADGGSVSVRLPSAPDCLDPAKTGGTQAYEYLVLDNLISINAKGRYVGDLATKYTANKAGTKLTFYLRHGVRFSNGDPFTARDVKFSFDRTLDPATKSPIAASMLAGIQTTRIINSYTVELDLKSPFRPLLTNLAGTYTGILDHKVTPTCTNVIGTGPYRVQSTGVALSDLVLVPNKYHNFAPSWIRNTGRPYISRLEFTTVPSDSTAASELLAGDLDVLQVPGTQLSRIQGNNNFVIHKTPPQNLIFIEFNVSRPPFNDPAVRKAFAETINRQNIVSAALNNQGTPVYGPIPPSIPDYDKKAGALMPRYNIGAAQQTIQAKHATGPYTFLVLGLPDLSTMAEVVQQAAGQAGMQLTLQTKTSVADFETAAAKGEFDVLTIQYTDNDPDVLYFLLDSSQGGGKGLNFTGAPNPAIDKLLEDGRVTLQKSKVTKIYAKAQELINKQLEFIGVASSTPLLALRSSIKGYHTDVFGDVAYQDLYIKTK